MNGNPTFPQELAVLPNWVCWRLEKDTKHQRDAKIPYCPATGKRASPSNPATWGTLDDALLAASQYTYSGIGFMFTAESGIIGIDIDHCLVNGQPNDVAADILAHLSPTYIEVSPSGTGLHIFLKGTIPSGGNRNNKSGVEMYSTGRYFTMTGRTFEKSSDFIAADDDAIKFIHEKYVSNQKKPKPQSRYSPFEPLSDADLLNLAEKSKDGAAFSELFNGNWQNKYKSQSEADFALCRKLAFWSGRGEAQIDRLFRRSGLYREKWNARHSAGGATYGEQTISNACNMTESIYSPPAPKKQPDIFEQGGCYYRRKGDKYYQITNFTVDPIEMIISDDEAQLTCDFVTEHGERFPQALLSSDFSTLAKLKAVLNKNTIALSFMGGEGDLELFKIYVYALKWQKKRGVKALGIYPRNKKLVFVDTTGAVGVGCKKVTDIVQMERFKVLDSNILKADFLDIDSLRALAEHILTYNEPAKTVPILAWAAGCYIKPHLRRTGVKYPHLFLIGEAGSGKSNTLERIILPIFSRAKVTASAQVTAFTLMRESNSSNIFPQAFDEFKPSKIDKIRLNWLYNHFRDTYDFHEGVRGRADQTAIVYDLLAPIIVAGEESADESAIRERSVELLFSKRDINQEPKHRDSFIWLTRNSKLLNALGRSLLDTALDTMTSEVSQWFEEGRGFFAGELPLRILDNLCCLYAGLCLTAKLCGRLGASWNEAFRLDREACTKHIEYGAREYLLDGGLSNKSVVEQTFEVMSRMPLKLGADFAFENNNEFLCLVLAGTYDRYTRYRRDCAIVGEVLPYSQFKKHLTHSEFFVEKNRTKRFGNDTKKVWVVDFTKLSQRCDVAGFIREKPDAEPPEPPSKTKQHLFLNIYVTCYFVTLILYLHARDVHVVHARACVYKKRDALFRTGYAVTSNSPSNHTSNLCAN